MNYRLITNNKFYNLPIWGELSFKEINGKVVSDDFITKHNLKSLQDIGAVKIIPIGTISVNNTKNLNSLSRGQRKTRKNLLEVASSEVDKEETTIPEI